MKLALSNLVAATILIWTAPASASAITFDDVRNDDYNQLYTSFNSGGFTFTGKHMHVIEDSFGIGAAYNGSQYLVSEADQGFGGPITFSDTDGSLFNLISADISEIFRIPTSINNFYSINFTGYGISGKIYEESFLLDGINDGFFESGPILGGANDFQTISFTNWTDLTRVTMRGVDRNGNLGDLAVDNIVTTTGAVPEPGTWLTMILGFVAIGYAMRRSKLAHQVV